MTTHRAEPSAQRTAEVKATAAETAYASADTAEPSTCPMTGEEYVASIRDGRRRSYSVSRVRGAFRIP
jgi:hypothetical protein